MITPAEIIDEVAQVTGVPAEMILGEKRTRCVAYARFLAVAAIRERQPWASLEELAHAVGRGDHGQAIHALKRCRELMTTDVLFARYARTLSIHHIIPATP